MLILLLMLALCLSGWSLWRGLFGGGGHSSPQIQRHSLSRILASSPQSPNPPDYNGVYDVVVLGSGPAGLSAALFAARSGLSVNVLGSASGMLSETFQLDNFPSFLGSKKHNQDGMEWLKTTKQQAEQFGATFAQSGLLASSIRQQQHGVFQLTTQLDDVLAHSVIVATGAKLQQLGLPGEDSLWGHSLHTCAICDGSMYKNRNVVVVGGGDAAVDAALLISRYASKVTLIHRRTEFRAKNQVTLQLLKATPTIDVLTPYQVVEWETAPNSPHQLIGVLVKENGQGSAPQRVACDGAFVLIGATPNTEWLKQSFKGLDTNADGLLVVGKSDSGDYATATSIPGIFAAGEVTDNIYKQAITAASAGARAGIDVERWLREAKGMVQRRAAASGKLEKEQVRAEDYFEARKPLPRTSSKHAEDCDLTTAECIQSLTNKYPVVVFSKPSCPYCRKALEALSLEGVSPEKTPNAIHVIDLASHEHGSQIQDTLLELTGRRTVPNVFIGGKSIGGGDETVQLQTSGGLAPLLQEAKALEMADDKVGCDLSDAECISKVVKGHPVVVFAKASCPECGRIFELLSVIGVKDPFSIDLTAYGNLSQDIQYNLHSMTGRHAVPNIFIGGESIGGYDLAKALHEQEKLVPMLQQHGAL
jgi:thioredoxin reductase (NADPH)